MAVGGYGNTARLKVAQSKTVNGATLYQTTSSTSTAP